VAIPRDVGELIPRVAFGRTYLRVPPWPHVRRGSLKVIEFSTGVHFNMRFVAIWGRMNDRSVDDGTFAYDSPRGMSPA
jgi:hypothetical protein